MMISASNHYTSRAGRPLPAPVARLGWVTGAVVGVMALISCASGSGPTAAGSSAAGVAASHAASLRPASPRPELPVLTPEQMAGQRVIYSYAGLTPPASLLRWIRHGEAAGVIFFGGNIASTAQLASVISELDRANAAASNPLRALPLLLMTDQEGGVVRRLPGAPVPSESDIGQSPDPAAQARAAGRGAGRNLKAAAGLNVNLAPVLDVYRAPGNFDDQYGRSYSMNPRVVATLGADFIRSQQATGVAATAKHFPGLGAADATENTDLRPVTLDVSLPELRTVDEFPYRAAIAAGVKLVMLNWAVYPALDASRPAGLSPAVINGELRRRLGFTGVTITDGLEAGALQPFGGIGHRARLAAGAGMDLILCSGQKAGEGATARAALVSALRSGALGGPAFTAALARISALRSGLR